MLTPDKKKKIIEKYRVHATDTGSPQVQIAILTEEVKELTEHFGEIAGGVLGAKLASRGRPSMASKRGLAGAAVGAIAGKHIALGIAGAASRRLKAKR
jgi:hypothetical protein